MKFTQVLAPAAGLIAGAQAHYAHGNGTYSLAPPVYTTVTTTYETYCPGPTTFIHKNVTYTATEETTITLTNCPCTIKTEYPPPEVTTHEGETEVVTVTKPAETVILDCTPVGEDGKPTPTGHDEPHVPSGAVPVPPPQPSEGGEEPSEVVPVPSSSASGTPEEVPQAGAERVAAGLGAAAVAGLFAFLL